MPWNGNGLKSIPSIVLEVIILFFSIQKLRNYIEFVYIAYFYPLKL